MRSKVFPALVSLAAWVMVGCHEQPVALQDGTWKGTFETQHGAIPFNFDIARHVVYLTNGEERAALDSVRYERDSVVIPIDIYDAVLVARVSNDALTGYFRKNQVARQGIPFTAARGVSSRFDVVSDKPAQVNGKWAVTLTNEKQESRYTVGLLNQHGTDITGTILTTTGDYRYLQGVVDGDSIKLSAFSGSNPTLFRAHLTDNTHLSGEFVSPGGLTKLAAIKSDTAHLPDPYTLTYLNKGYEKLSFSFPDLTGRSVSLDDDKYKNKVLIVTIMGSWCPNCVDEAAFLSPWYKKNKDRGVEIIGLSFERKDDLAFAKKRLDVFIKRFDIQYDILFAGLADKGDAGKKLPALNAVLSFPTTILIDRAGKVRKIHTGFTGPATGEHYEEFIRHFNKDVDAIIDPALAVK